MSAVRPAVRPAVRLALSISLAASAALAGCANSYSMVGYDVASRSHGVAAAAVGKDDGQTGTVAAGFGAGPVALEAVLRGHDLETTHDRWLSASGGLELKVRVLKLGPTQTFVHGGAVRALLLDRDRMAITWGVGYAYGATFAVGKAGVRAYVDAHVEELTYTGAGTMSGAGTISTTTAGIMLGR
jgi:hypothetical protein